ncbi:MAG: hypothetical protein IJ379_09835 [Lachnospiraceae bacterium]|nr:hypothetical protein [Lachnospiraceae bacterium]
MADHITTYTGIHFEPTEPDADKLNIQDIAHALSLICRGNGHVKTFFSVGQHCIRCALEAEARGYSGRVVLACLLHDASEAYMSDVPRPFKKYLKEYKEFEEKLLEVVYTKYLGSTLTKEEEALIKEIDDELLYFDMLYLLGEHMREEPPVLKTSFTYEFVPFEAVEKAYLEVFAKYTKTP